MTDWSDGGISPNALLPFGEGVHRHDKEHTIMNTNVSLPDISNHPALVNPILDRASAGFSTTELAVIMPNYRVFTVSFPAILAGLISRCDVTAIQFHLAGILFSELGSGQQDKAHAVLFTALEHSMVPVSLINTYSGDKLVTELKRLYWEEDFAAALGAQTALENQAGPMLEKLGAAFRQIVEGKESLPEFFAIHMDDEPEHERAMLECMQLTILEATTFKRGFDECLGLFASFWSELSESTKLSH